VLAVGELLTSAPGPGEAQARLAVTWIFQPLSIQSVLFPQLTVVVGMALGYADEATPETRLQTIREPVKSFARFHD
jgi:hypothetical protein